ncbi:MAG: ROK family protein [Nitrososphaeria archaeon]
MKCVIAVDVGASNLRLATFSGRKMKNRISFKLQSSVNPIDYIEEYLKKFSQTCSPIGIASAGPIDIKKGSVKLINYNNLTINYVESLKGYGDVYITNDCIAGLLAEKRFGEAKKTKNAVYLTFSSGIGAGVMVDGHILIGKDGNAHEIGHLVLNYEDDTVCGCGKNGHWEAYCGGKSMPKFFYKVTGKKVISPEEIFKMYYEGQSEAVEFIEKCMKINAAGLASLIDAYDPEVIILSGSVYLNNEDVFMKKLQELTKNYVMNRMPELTTARLREDSVIFGAGILATLKGKLP